MTAWLQLIPVPILLFIAALMIVPSAVAIWVRFSLYHTLKALSQNLKRLDARKIEEIKEGFKRAAARLDFTNTTDILEKFYSQEKLFGLSYDYWDNFCQLLPNLLIAFGLLGTFLGITFNLGDISAILNQDADGASLVVANLKAPLQSMGIAFVTSLVAIALSSLLTILNLFWNTETAKYNLFITLEEYLEIDFSPVEKDIQDKAKTLLNSVLYGQGENTSHSLDSVLTTVLNNFAPSLTALLNSALYGQEQSPEKDTPYSLDTVLTTVLNRFVPPLTKSIQSFTGAIETFQSQVEIMKTSTESFSNSAQSISSATKSIANSQDGLHNWVVGFDTTQEQFNKSVQNFAQHIDNLTKKNQELISKIQEVINTNRNSSELIDILGERLKKSGEQFKESSDALAKSQFPERLKGASDNLHQFSQFAADLNKIILDFQSAIPPIRALGESTQHLNQQSGEIITLNQQRLIQEEKELTAIQGKLAALIELMKESQAQSLSTLQENVNALITTFSEEMEINAQKLQDLYQGMKSQTQRTEQIQGELVKLTGSFSQGLERINDQGQSGARQLEAIQGSFSALVKVFKQYQESLNLKQDLIDLSQRLASTLSQDSQKQTQDIGELMALENRKNKQETANLSYSLNVSLSHLEDISLKLSKLTSLIQDLTLPQNPR